MQCLFSFSYNQCLAATLLWFIQACSNILLSIICHLKSRLMISLWLITDQRISNVIKIILLLRISGWSAFSGPHSPHTFYFLYGILARQSEHELYEYNFFNLHWDEFWIRKLIFQKNSVVWFKHCTGVYFLTHMQTNIFLVRNFSIMAKYFSENFDKLIIYYYK